MDFLTLGLGLLAGFIIGHLSCWVVQVRPLVRTVVEMKKLGFNEYPLPEKPSGSEYTYFVRED